MDIRLSDEQTTALLAELDRIIDGDSLPAVAAHSNVESNPRKDPTRAGPRRPVAAAKALRATVKGALPAARVNRYSGPPATLGSTAAAQAQIIVWCKDCRHQVEPDAAVLAERYGAATTVPEWRNRLVCSQCGSRNVDMVVSGTSRQTGC
jgi:hypothetical protein